MTDNTIIIRGCRPQPLVSYLKAFGIFRLISGQKDPNVRGLWRNGFFELITMLDREQIVNFFIKEYRPTPIVSPWNGGSGFYEDDSTKGVDAILNSSGSRFEEYRNVIKMIFSLPMMPPKINNFTELIEALEQAADNTSGKKQKVLQKQIAKLTRIQPQSFDAIGCNSLDDFRFSDFEKKIKELKGPKKKKFSDWFKETKGIKTKYLKLTRERIKDELLLACRAQLPESALSWFDAAVAITASGRSSFNPLLGSGGNDGRLEFSNKFMQRVSELLITGELKDAEGLLEGSLFSGPQMGLVKGKVGQFDPGKAGGFNQGFGIAKKNFKINPWDYILAIEGAAVFIGSIAKRSVVSGNSRAAFPFTVSFSPVGFSTSSGSDDGRGEMWLPTWPNPASFGEVKYFIGEGRSSIGRRMARTGIDFTRAVGSLGVDRGIDSFTRYAFLVRLGKNHVALPAGVIPVRSHPNLRIIDELDLVLDRLDIFLNSLKQNKNLPATFENAKRGIDNAIFECALDPVPGKFINLVRAIGRMEYLIARRNRTKDSGLELKRPLHGLTPRWVRECDDGSTEIRIAAALSSIHATGIHGKGKVGPIRSNLSGIDPDKPKNWASGSGQKCWYGNSFVERIGGVLAQRIMDAKRVSANNIPIEAFLALNPRDLVPFLYGKTDDLKIEELLWGLMLIDWRHFATKKLMNDWQQEIVYGPLPRCWCLLKLLHTPGKIRGVRMPIESRIIALLKAGRADGAINQAQRWFRINDLKPLPVQNDDRIAPMRQLAALLIPTKNKTLLESLVLEKTNSN